MKKMMIMVSAIMMAAAANAKSIETKPFNSVMLSIPSNVRVLYGESYQVDVRSLQPEQISNLKLTVEDGVLKIRWEKQYDNAEAKPVRLTIIAPVDPEMKSSRNVSMKTVKHIDTQRDMANND